MLDPEAVKRDSEAIIRRAGGDMCDCLPFLERDAKPRELDAVVRRTLILNAMLQIYFKAPVAVIKDWITRNRLTVGALKYGGGSQHRFNHSSADRLRQ